MLPRQVCDLYTTNVWLDEYLGGMEKFLKNILGGNLFLSILFNPVSYIPTENFLLIYMMIIFCIFCRNIDIVLSYDTCGSKCKEHQNSYYFCSNDFYHHKFRSVLKQTSFKKAQTLTTSNHPHYHHHSSSL